MISLWGLLATFLVAVSSVNGQWGGNVTTIVGTWSSGYRNVVTGAGFANPANLSFIIPKTSGISYSFSEDMFYEIARYRYIANATHMGCITGVLQWVHGNYTLNPNNTISMTPFQDGFQQIQDPCAQQSIIIDPTYNHTELYSLWTISQDPVMGPKLWLYEQDGTPLAPQYLVTASPNMLPTTTLRNLTGSAPPPLTTTAGYITQGRRSHVERSMWNWGN